MLEDRITIVHIAYINDDVFSGVNVAVIGHVTAQQNIANVALYNIADSSFQDDKNHFDLKKNRFLEALPIPFRYPDLVVFHEVYRPRFISLYKYVQKRKIPYVIIPHGCLCTFAQKKKRIKKQLANIVLFNSFIKHAKAIQYLSETERNNSAWKDNSIVLSNGISIPQFKDEENCHDGFIFCFIGRLDIKIKGLDLLIEASSMVRDILMDKNGEIHIYGCNVRGSVKKLSNLIERKNLSDLIKIHEAVRGEEKKKILTSIDCFVQVSRSEGLPMGVLEALSYGVPCLVSNTTGLSKQIQECDAGWTCETTAESIATKLVSIISENSNEEKSFRAKELATCFSWETVAKNTVRTYQELLK